MTKNFQRYRAKRLEQLAKIDPDTVNRKATRAKLRRTIKVALETGRPDRADWCQVLLKKFAPKKGPEA